MKELDVKLGYACNNNCVFCLNQDKRAYKTFPREAIIGQVERSARSGCRKLIISGGEPLINPYFFAVLDFARETGIEIIEIQTNARMLYYEEFLEKILRYRSRICVFLVSLHFPDNKQYKEYCRSDGFDQAVAGIKNLLKNNLPLTVNTVVMNQNLEILQEITSLLRSIGVRHQQFRMIDGSKVQDHYHDYVPAMSKAVQKIKKVVKKYEKEMDFTVREIPACILGKKMAFRMAPPANPQRENLSIGNKVFMSDEIVREQFVFSGCCDHCFVRKSCCGVRKEYAEIYGLSELKAEKERER